jgi:hypothetical protein
MVMMMMLHYKPPNETECAYGVDTNGYIDIGATNHVTGQLNKLNVHEPYQGHDQVNNSSEQGMDIAHIGHSVVFYMFPMHP